MGIILLPQQLGNEPDAIKGFFLENKRLFFKLCVKSKIRYKKAT